MNDKISEARHIGAKINLKNRAFQFNILILLYIEISNFLDLEYVKSVSYNNFVYSIKIVDPINVSYGLFDFN